MRFENSNFVGKGRKAPKAILLHSLCFEDNSGDKTVIDENYIINELKRREITKVKASGKATTDPVIWVQNVRSGKKRNLIHLLFFIEIFSDILFNDYDNDYFREIHPSRKFLKSLIPSSKGQLSIMLEILTKIEIIERGKSYLAKSSIRKSDSHIRSATPKSLKIHRRWKDHKVWYDAETNRKERLLDTRDVIPAEKYLTKRNDEKRQPPPKHPYLREAIEDNIQSIDIWDNAFELFNTERVRDGKKPAKESVVKTVHSFAALSIRNSPKKQAVWNVYANYKETTGRIYHTLSSYPSNYRFMLSFKGFPIWQVDVKSAHVFLLVCLYDKAAEYKEKIWDHLNDKQLESAIRRLKTEKRKYLKRFNYINDFYLTVAKLAKIPQEENQSDEDYREMIKKGFYSFAMGEPDKKGKESVLTKIYEKEFPILLRAMNHFKSSWWMQDDLEKYGAAVENIKNGMPKYNKEALKAWTDAGKNPDYFKPKKWNQIPYKQLSYELSLIEGDIMINGICAELAKWKPEKPQDPKKVWFIPNHDAIWTNQGSLRVVKRVMRKHWEKRIGDIPAWESKSLGLKICDDNLPSCFLKAGYEGMFDWHESKELFRQWRP